MIARKVSGRRVAHERMLLTGIALLLLLGTVPVFAHHLPIPGMDALGAVDTVGAFCMVALHLLLAPVHGLVHVLLGAGLAYAAFDRGRAALRLRWGLRSLDLRVLSPGSRIFAAAMDAGLSPARVVMAARTGNPAFTFGAWRPSVCIGEQLAERLTNEELGCVLAHEAHHVRRRDPLRLSVLRFLGLTLFWIPALRRMAADVAIDAELEADQAGAGKRPLIMASALVKAARERPTLDLLATTPLISDDLLAVRVRRLTGDSPPVPSRVNKRAFLGATAALCVVWLSGAAVAHPLDTHAGGNACLHHAGWPGSHLFCDRYVPGAVPCPHALAREPSTSHVHP